MNGVLKGIWFQRQHLITMLFQPIKKLSIPQQAIFYYFRIASAHFTGW